MAKKVKVSTHFTIIDALNGFERSSGSLRHSGIKITGEMKKHISRGLSPVRGEGKYASYVADRKGSVARKLSKSLTGDRKKRASKRAREVANDASLYPNSVKSEFPSKGKKPINLKLSGNMLRHLTHWIRKKKGKVSLVVGIQPNAPDLIQKMAEAHNDGTLVHKNVPQRKFIPNKKGDKFNATITRLIKDLFSKEINKTIKKSNKKS